MAIHRINNALVCIGTFNLSGAPANGLSPSVDIYEIPMASGSPSAVVSGGSATFIARGAYYYRLALADVDANALYAFGFYVGSGADQLVIWQGWSVGMGWTENLSADLATIGGYLDTEVAAIKAKTDQLTFTLTGKVDASIQAAGDFAQAAADKVWSTTVRTLSAAGVQAIWDALTSALTTVGSIGKRLVDNLTGDIYARLGAPTGASVSADIASVQADTNDLQAKIGTPSGASLSADVISRLAASSYEAPPAIANIVDAVWDEPSGDHVTADTMGAQLNTAAAASGASIAEDLEAIRAKTDLISAGGVTLQTPFNPLTGKLTLTRGDDYPAEHAGRIPAFTSSDWPDLTDAQEIRMTVRVRNPQTGEGEDIIFTLLDTESERVAGDEEQSVTVEPLHAPDGSPAANEQVGGTDDLTPGNNTAVWDIQATLEDGTIKTLVKGKVDVIEDETR